MSGDIWCGAEPGDYSALVAKAGPCRLGGKHSEPGFNGMVYCEHGVSVYACHQGCTDLPPLDPKCETCGRLKDDHTEAEAAYCITRQIAEAVDRPVYIAGLPGAGRKHP
jgi:hypothetical protein